MKIFVCKTYEKVFRKASEGRACEIIAFPPLCFTSRELADDFFTSRITNGDNYAVLGSHACLPDKVKLGLSPEKFHLETLCANYLLNGDYVDYLMKNRYVASSFWVEHFTDIVTKHWGFDQDTARNFFKESVQGITVLNELNQVDIIRQSQAISDYLDMPVEILPVGSDLVSKKIDQILVNSKYDEDLSHLNKQLQNAKYKMAEYLMVFDFIGGLKLDMTEKELLTCLTELLMLLTAARYVFVCHQDDDNLDWTSNSDVKLDKDLLDQYMAGQSNSLLLEDSNGFMLKHTNDSGNVLLLYVSDVLFVDKTQEYLDLLSNVIDMLHIGIARVKDFSKYKQLIEDLSMVNAKLSEVEREDYIRQHIAAIAHELNSPIAIGVTIGSFIEDITHKLKSQYESGKLTKHALVNYIDEVEEIVGTLHENMENAKGFIEAFRQVAVDQASDEFREIDLVAYMKSVVKIMRPLLKTNHCSVTFTGCDHLMIYTNPSAVSQVITNLVQNAIIYGQDEVCSINIHVVMDEAGQSLEIFFSDMGPGIEPSLLGHIFEPFFTTRKGKGGSGLGLAIIKKIIEKDLNGGIEYVDDKHCGACFRITMPLEARSIKTAN